MPARNRNRVPARAAVAALALAALAGAPSALASTAVVSVSTGHALGNRSSSNIYPSADGRFFAFGSNATNLVPDDLNTASDVFVRDRVAGTTVRISLGPKGVEGNSGSGPRSISADGRYVVYRSNATNILPAGNRSGLIYLYDRHTGQTSLVSVSTAGVTANLSCDAAAISADGTVVAFDSQATNLVPGDLNGEQDIFVRDLAAGVTTRVSVSSAGAESDGISRLQSHYSISADGRLVVFNSEASNLVPPVPTSSTQAYLHDRATGVTRLLSVTTSGGPGNLFTAAPAIAADGSVAVFVSSAQELVFPTTVGSQLFARDLATNQTTLLNIAMGGGPSNGLMSNAAGVSADGSIVAFTTSGSNLVPGDTNNTRDIYRLDRATGVITRVSVSGLGVQTNSFSQDAGVSGDGLSIVFFSNANNLVTGDINAESDVFVVSDAFPCPGDADGDAYVDFADLNHVLSDFGQSGPNVIGDVNHDGVVNFADLNDVLAHFAVAC